MGEHIKLVGRKIHSIKSVYLLHCTVSSDNQWLSYCQYYVGLLPLVTLPLEKISIIFRWLEPRKGNLTVSKFEKCLKWCDTNDDLITKVGFWHSDVSKPRHDWGRYYSRSGVIPVIVRYIWYDTGFQIWYPKCYSRMESTITVFNVGSREVMSRHFIG